MSRESFLFDNAKFRNNLIDKILNGLIHIDTNFDQCIKQYFVRDDNDLNDSDNIENDLINNLDQKNNYAKILTDLGYRISYLGQGNCGFSFSICQIENQLNGYALKMIVFSDNPKYGSFNDPNRPENMEIFMIKKLNEEILLPKISPHINLYIRDFTCDGLLTLYAKNNQKLSMEYRSFLLNLESDDEEKKNAYIVNRSNLLISELAVFGSLDSYLNKYEKTITNDIISIIYFQVIYTFAQIEKVLPGFRHNDCHLSNILAQIDQNYLLNTNKDKFYIYAYDDHFYKVPVIQIQSKLWDFFFSNIAEQTNNPALNVFSVEKWGLRNNDNHYYDLHMFTNAIFKFIIDFHSDEGLIGVSYCSEFIDFLKRVVPEKYRGFYCYQNQPKIQTPKKYSMVDLNIMTESNESCIINNGRLIVDDHYTTAKFVLTNDQYIKNKYETSLNQIQIEQIVDSYGIDFDQLKKRIETSY
jgi:hypothetical protein